MMRGLILALHKKSTPPPFTWIVGTSVLSQRTSKRFTNAFGYLVEGGLSLSPESVDLQGFDEYFKDLIEGRRNTTNPWFRKYVDEYSNCKEVRVINLDPKETKCIE